MNKLSTKLVRSRRIPATAYRTLAILLRVVNVPHAEDILWDIRWGYRREWNKRRRLDRFDRSVSTNNWFYRQLIAALIYGIGMRLIRILMWIFRLG